MTDLFLLALYICLGLAVGSFLNLCIDRLPLGQSIISPPSHCSVCQRRLDVVDLAPVFSYLFLRGRCRTCGTAIPLRVLVVELLSGGAFGFLWWWLGPGLKLAVASLYAGLFILIAAIDLERHLVLNRIIYPAILIAPIAALAYGLGINQVLLGGAIGFVFMLVPYLLSGGGMGAGDAKLAAFVGLISGFPGVLVALFAATSLGGLVAAALLLTGKKGRKDPVPYAPFLVAGAAVAVLWGEAVTDWYFGLW